LNDLSHENPRAISGSISLHGQFRPEHSRGVHSQIATRIGLFTALRDEDPDAMRIREIGEQTPASLS
jgi:hypothetical protein